jgi:signal transduction histidine kinase
MSTSSELDAVYAQLNESKRRIDLIRSLTFELNKILPLSEKLYSILKTLNEQFGISYCMILLADNASQMLAVKASYGYEHDNSNFEVAFGESIAGIAAVRRRAINITGIQRKRHYLNLMGTSTPTTAKKFPGLADPQSQIAIPLLANDELVAVLVVESYQSSVFNKDDEDFLITISQAIAVSIQNAILFDNMEAMIARRTSELEKSNFTKDRLFSIISHDLRGPVTSFHNIAKLINHYHKLGETEKIERLSMRIDHSVNKLNHLLDNLLHWSLTQTNEIRCSIDKVNMLLLLQEVIDTYQESVTAKELVLTTVFDSPVEVAGDYPTLSTVFRNILSNAIKYTPRGGAIHIEAILQDSQVLIKLTDSGIGIPDEKLLSIFNLDDRKSTQGTENEKGTGLGLIVAKEFVALNKGMLHITSSVDKGTTVAVFLPPYEL